MKRYWLLWGIVLGIGCTPSPPPVTEPPTTDVAGTAQDAPALQADPVRLAVFAPSPELALQFGQPVELDGYSMSPPANYRRVIPKVNSEPVPGQRDYTFIGTQREDGSSPVTLVSIVTPNLAEPLPGVEVVLGKMVNKFSQRRTNWKQSEPTYGMLGGIKFGRVEWTGTRTENGRDMMGVIYVAVDQESIIQLHSQDYVENGDALRLGEAALLTFKKL